MTPLDTLIVVAPVFLTLGGGAFATRSGRFRAEHIDGLMNFGQNYAIPCLLFRTLSQLDLAAAFDVNLLASFYLGSALCFLIGAAGAMLLFRRGSVDAVILGFSSLYCNAVLLGLPITERAVGKEGLPAIFAIVSFQAPVCYLIGITAMEVTRANGDGAHKTAIRTAKALTRQPNMIALALGFAANLSGLHFPAFATTTLDMVGGAGLPISLFALGGALSGYRLRGSLMAASFVAAISLLVRPAIVLLLGGLVFHLPQPTLHSAVMMAAMAPGVNTYIFANIYGHARDVAGSAVLLGTMLSVLTATIWITILAGG
ncbi:AEC family transporter [Rhizorhabdus sp.]|jgi:malonate transporter and related proteins|uniref:AEC family transporter n=1 Tax=Rhizorhabdus sp. TaxID=1968843 RepID=UPI0019BB9265|nr:AEC family transporter [Rhizorhabdus sp.]MBD3760405.1 AEC family transporter [Rhizorhabdus sp.]